MNCFGSKNVIRVVTLQKGKLLGFGATVVVSLPFVKGKTTSFTSKIIKFTVKILIQQSYRRR